MSESLLPTQRDLLIVGGGYVGLPLALLAGGKGRTVIVFDISTSRCEQLKNAQSGFGRREDEQLAHLLEEQTLQIVDLDDLNSRASSFKFSEIVICVPTPTNEDKVPDLSYVEQAVDSILKVLDKETLLVLESSTFPGTTREIVLPKIMSNLSYIDESEILLAYSPERVDPGNKEWNSSNTPRLLSGINAKSLKRSVDFYTNLGIPVHEVSSPEIAEAAKLFENSFRLVNISFVNEFTSVMRRLGLDPLEIIRAANTKPFGIMRFHPGPGIGGHCIPVDPYYLTWWSEKKKLSFEIIKAAQEINEQMPKEAVRRVKQVLGENLTDKRILLAGVTYKPGIADLRETPAEGIWEALKAEGSLLNWWDPLVESWRERTRWSVGLDVDLVVIVTDTELPVEISRSARILNLNS